MKTIIHNYAIHTVLIAGLLLLSVATNDPIKDALSKSLMIFVALNFIRVFSQVAHPTSDDSSNNSKKKNK